MIFKLKADVEFEAEDIDDAFLFWENHFNALREGKDPPIEFLGGEIDIKPYDEKS